MLRRLCDKVKLSSDSIFLLLGKKKKMPRPTKELPKFGLCVISGYDEIQTGLNSSQDLATMPKGVLNSRNFR